MTRQASEMSGGSTLAEELEGMESEHEMIQHNLLLHKQRLDEPEDMGMKITFVVVLYLGEQCIIIF